MAGLRAELVFENAEGCPVAVESAAASGPLTDVTWSDGEEGTVSEQVRAEGESLPSFDPVFDYGTQTVYEFEREESEPCICERIQSTLGPVSDVHAVDGDLHVTLHAADIADLRETIADLRERFGTVSVEYLVRSVEEADGRELVPVDLRRLTDRQREVLDTAHEMGYFDYPREANAGEVASELGIEQSTFAEHLAAAQSKLLDELSSA